MRLRRPVRAIVIAVALLLSASGLRAQQACNVAPFLAPASWAGSVTITGTGSGTISFTGGHTDYNISQSITLAPLLAAKQEGFNGPQNATVNVNETFITSLDGVPGTTTDTVTANGSTAFGPSGTGSVLAFDNIQCVYDLTVDSEFSQFVIDGQTQLGEWGWILAPTAPPSPVWNQPLPTSGTTLTGNQSFNAPVATSNGGTYPVHWTVNWSFSPTTDLDVIVTIPSYSTWRPTGGLNEAETGLDPATGDFNSLEIQAQLVQKDTGQVVDFSPDKWTFSLVDVSHEPGVVMNWPPKAQVTGQPDMTFDKQACATPAHCAPVPENANLDTSDPLNAVLTPADPFSFASVQVALLPHDWGGWATLNVTATVGGLNIVGHLQQPTPLANGPAETDILLPQRQAGSFIADSWKTAHGVALSTLDSDDSENTPKGDSQQGDGLTLYEEYRGFYMGCTASLSEPQPEGSGGCQRVEGDPNRKDLFVVNTMPAVAGPGLLTFKQATDLNVHFLDMTIDDADPLTPPLTADRVINFNHSAAPHEVDQHAIVIDLGQQQGFSIAQNLPGRPSPGLPKDIQSVEVDALYRTYPLAYVRRMIAHELSHSADVYHHGDIDEGRLTWKVDSNGNITENGVPIYVKNEGDDPSILKTTVSLGKLRFGQNVSQTDWWVGNNACTQTGPILMNGQHSGSESSYMRYIAAEAYVPAGFPQVRFLTGGEVFGFALPSSPLGTGVNDPNRGANAPNHRPGPRYGDAYSGAPNQLPGPPGTERGDDALQLDVNDNNKEIERPLQPPCP